MRSSVNLQASSCPRLAIAMRASSSRMASTMLSARCSADDGGTINAVSRWRMKSAPNPVSVVTEARPRAMASIKARPKPSDREGNRNTACRCNSAICSESGRRGSTCTRAPAPALKNDNTSASDSPLPPIVNLASGSSSSTRSNAAGRMAAPLRATHEPNQTSDRLSRMSDGVAVALATWKAGCRAGGITVRVPVPLAQRWR